MILMTYSAEKKRNPCEMALDRLVVGRALSFKQTEADIDGTAIILMGTKKQESS
jgi:hypothetical protein